MPKETEKQKRKKKLFKVLLVVLGVFALCCGLSTGAAIVSAPSIGPEPEPTWTPASTPTATIVPLIEDTATPTLEPTEVPPTPTEVPGEAPASLDYQYLLGTMACLDDQLAFPALSTLGDALSEEPPNIVVFCVGVPSYQSAVAHDKACWVSAPLPDHPYLLEQKRLFEMSLDKQVLVADLYLDFCATGDLGYLDLALEVLTEATVLVNQATDAVEGYGALLD